MLNWRLLIAVVLTAVCGNLPDASAKPLDLKDVSADASWLGHLDFDAMRESTVVQKMMEQQKHKKRMAFAAKMLGMNPEQDLHGMTFYGNETGKHTGVMILHAKVDRDRVMGMAKMIPSREVTKHREHEIHQWTHKSRHGSRNRTVAAAFYGDEWIVFASSIDLLKTAVDVLDGKAPSLTNDSSLAGNIPAGTTMLMRAEGLSDAELPDKCKLARQTKSFRFVTGEHDGQSFYRSRAEMTNKEVASQVQELVEGLRALGQIHVGDNESGRKLVDDLRVKTNGTTVSVLWKGPASDVWTMIETHKKIFKEKMEKYRKRHGDGHHDHWHKRWHDRYKDKKKGEPKKEKGVAPEEDF
ncbi:MAG TPA: hypothetical protein VMX74_06265 [Pirellulales bacterium]|nr:hypothetical protein [Pirellulales bacterium]